MGDEISIPLPDVKGQQEGGHLPHTFLKYDGWCPTDAIHGGAPGLEGGPGTRDMNARKQAQADTEFVRWARDEMGLTVAAVGCNASVGWTGCRFNDTVGSMTPTASYTIIIIHSRFPDRPRRRVCHPC